MFCKECRETIFVQCENDICNYRKGETRTDHSGNLAQSSIRPTSHDDEPIELINLEKAMMSRLLGADRFKTLSWLLRNSIDINRLAYKDKQLIIWACQRGYRHLVELLLQHGADPNSRTQDDVTALAYAIHGNCTHMVDMLVAHGCDVDEQVHGINYLNRAVILNKPEMVKCLLHWGADPNSRSRLAPAPLYNCAAFYSAPILQLLLSHGATIEAATFQSTTLIAHYIECERSDLLELIIKSVGLQRCQEHEIQQSGRSLMDIVLEDTCCYTYLLSLGLDAKISHREQVL